MVELEFEVYRGYSVVVSLLANGVFAMPCQYRREGVD